jgi:hypothetical protein
MSYLEQNQVKNHCDRRNREDRKRRRCRAAERRVSVADYRRDPGIELARLLGGSSRGSKETLIVRLLAERELCFSNWLVFQTTLRSWQIPINTNRSTICAG